MCNEEYVEPDSLRLKAGEFESEVAAPLHDAYGLLRGRPSAVALPAYSALGWSAGIAYTATLNYTLADLDTKTTTLADYKVRLESVARDWEAAEEASTVE